ncbi:MAG: hypothetical protein Q6359_00235 [Candidatus Brocadiales bacterium]|nr:hypothetical protein [Candidatus Brocadiales bacterium]
MEHLQNALDFIKHSTQRIVHWGKKLSYKDFKSLWNVQNIIYLTALTIILSIGGYYRLLEMDSNVRIRNGFESTVSMASYLFMNPAASYHDNLVKPEYSIYDSFPISEYSNVTNGADDFTFIRNPVVEDSFKEKGLKFISRSELGWAFILRYVLPNGMKGSQNMAMRIVRFNFVIELILITLLFFIGERVAGILGATLAALLYALFCPAVHMMSYITYYYWAIPFSVFSLFFWIVIYEGLDVGSNLKKKILLFFFYGALMGFATATRMVFLYLPLFLSPFILYKERKIKPAVILLVAMLSGQFLLLVPQMFVNKKQFGKFAITTRDTWHAVFTGVGIYKNPYGIENSGDFAVYDYIKRTSGVDIYTDGFDAYNLACKKQAIKLIKENPELFINNAIKNLRGAYGINPSGFYGIDFPINKDPSLEELQKVASSLTSNHLRDKYFLWLVLLALITSFFSSQGQFRMFLLVIAQSLYLVLVICLYFPNYLYYLSGYIPCWSLILSLSLAIVLREPVLYIKSLFERRFIH